MEIAPQQADDVERLASESGFSSVEIGRDLSQRQRWLRARGISNAATQSRRRISPTRGARSRHACARRRVHRLEFRQIRFNGLVADCSYTGAADRLFAIKQRSRDHELAGTCCRCGTSVVPRNRCSRKCGAADGEVLARRPHAGCSASIRISSQISEVTTKPSECGARITSCLACFVRRWVHSRSQPPMFTDRTRR